MFKYEILQYICKGSTYNTFAVLNPGVRNK